MRTATKPKLTSEEWETVGAFSDYAFDYSPLDLEAVAKKAGVRFPATATGRLFRKECKAVFDRERAG